MLQLTNITVPGQLNMTYNYPTGSNNGKIGSQSDAITGETVTYQYDSLNRLLSASGSGWASTYGYDGFGNLTSKTPTAGSPPTLSVAVDPATNRIIGQYYDANGNQLSAPALSGAALWYDAENRLTLATGIQYAYDSRNKRIWKATFDGNGNVSAQEVYFYGVDGQKLGTYSIGPFYYTQSIVVMADSPTGLAQYFGGKRVDIFQDRLGSRRAGSQERYYPYGEDGTNPLPNDQVKFATYTRDSATGLDYADQRYYANQFGRFMTPDPYKAGRGSGVAEDPQSWNRYSYTRNDPINRIDPRGWCDEEEGDDSSDCEDDDGSDPSYDPQRGPGPATSGIVPEKTMRDRWSRGLIKALKALQNPDCAGLFGLTGGLDGPPGTLPNPSPSPETVLALISNSEIFEPIPSQTNPDGTTTVTSAITTPTGPPSTIYIGNGATMQVWSAVQIQVNDVAGSFVTGGVNDYASTILHELGHAYWDLYGAGTSAIKPDANSTPTSMANTALVKSKCNL